MLTNIRGALRRMGEIVSAGKEDKRRTMAMPSVLSHFGTRSEGLPKPTPANLRKFAKHRSHAGPSTRLRTASQE